MTTFVSGNTVHFVGIVIVGKLDYAIVGRVVAVRVGLYLGATLFKVFLHSLYKPCCKRFVPEHKLFIDHLVAVMIVHVRPDGGRLYNVAISGSMASPSRAARLIDGSARASSNLSIMSHSTNPARQSAS